MKTQKQANKQQQQKKKCARPNKCNKCGNRDLDLQVEG